MHIIILYIYMAYEPLANWDTPSSHPQFVDCPTWQMEHHVFQNAFFGFQVSTQDKGKISSHDGISTMFQTDSEWWSVLHVCHGRLLHGRGMVIPLPFFYSGFPRFIPMKKWPLPPYLVGGWAYPSEKSESQYESVGMMTFPIYGKIIQMFQTTNQWWSCGKPRHVLTMALAFQLSNLP